MNLWTLGMLYIVLNTVGAAQCMMSNQAEINSNFTKMLAINKPLSWICIALISEVFVLFWSPIVLMKNIISLIKGSFK